MLASLLNDIKIKTQLRSVLGVLCLLLLIVASNCLYSMSQANRAFKEAYSKQLPASVALGQAMVDIDRARLVVNRVVIAEALGLPYDKEKLSKQIPGFVEDSERSWNAYLALEKAPEEQALVQNMLAARKKYVEIGFNTAIAGLKENDQAKVRDATLNLLPNSYGDLSKANKALSDFQVEAARHNFEDNESRYEQLKWICIALMVIGVLIAALCSVALQRTLVAPVDHALRHLEFFAQGDLSHKLANYGRNEIGRLMDALEHTRLRLQKIVSEVRQGTDAIATASAQIASGNLDLSGRTEQQASALEETAASLEELTSTVQHNATNANEANELARSTSAVAIEGGTLMEQVVSTMEAIHHSSQKIADIIGVIDGIAFQTNILALNAAVEAARAGEEGRGFAVVASEVRSLAQRSAAAAQEIKNLIDTSVHQVNNGSTLVAQAGSTIQAVVTNVKNVNGMISAISVASAEQSAGIAQVNQAVTQMDHVTQQNAALVEQAAAAAQSMQEQSAKLAAVVAVFQLA